MKNEIKSSVVRLGACVVLLVGAFAVDKLVPLPMWKQLLLYLTPYIVVGYDVLWRAVEGIHRGSVFNESFLMSIATIGALSIGFLPGGEPEFAEAVFVMLFYKVGELFEEIAEGNSERAISQLMDMRPDTANVERGGVVVTVPPDEVAVGEVITIAPGEKIPLDGVIIEGDSSLDTVALTGESVPRDVAVGDNVVSGCVNISGVLRVRTEKPFGESTASKILELVEHAVENKAKSIAFITKFARYYTPAVVFAALALALIPPVISGNFAGSVATWLNRALTFLVVSCPCALVISVPLTFFGGIGGASKKGVLIKGSNYMETLSKAGTVVFDKTGTLTEGVFTVVAVHPDVIGDTELLHLAAHVEHHSTHPIAVSLRQAYRGGDDDCVVSDIFETAGQGVCANVGGRAVCVGNEKLMESVGAKWRQCHRSGTVVHVSIDGEYAGHIVISDKIKKNAAAAIASLKSAGIKTVMLTGDREEVAATVAAELGVDKYSAQLLPADKVRCVEAIIEAKPRGSSVVFVGDGINDAPVLARSDVGVAMGALGSDAAVEAADVVLMDDDPSKVYEAVRASRRTLAIVKQNIMFALGVKLLVLVFAGVGLAPMWLAVFADVGVMLLAVLNAMRALKQ